MVNTRILTQELEYHEPTTVQEALELLDRYGPDARVIAGGTDLLVQMKQETSHPKHLVSIRKIPGLDTIEKGNPLRIGAATLLRHVLEVCSGEEKIVALFEAVKSLATVPIRNLGTIGGNICNASPAADTAPPLLVLDARVKISNLSGERELPMGEFFKEVNHTDAAPNEIVTEIRIPDVQENAGSAFQKIARVGAGISKVNSAALLTRDGDLCATCRIALGSVAPVPMRLHRAEESVVGRKIEPQLLKEAGRIASEEISPVNDVRSTAKYRKRLAAFLVEEVLRKAWQRTGV